MSLLPRMRLLLSWRPRKRVHRRRMLTILLLIVVTFVIITPFYIVYKPPEFIIHYFQRRFPDVLWEVSTSSKIIALTLDDAPSTYTKEILQLLKANNATATFFVIGSQANGPAQQNILADLVRNGNELANHAMYDEPSRALSDAVLAEQIEFVETRLADAYNAAGVDERPPKYFRPGFGFFNDRMRENLRSLGYRLVLGNIYPHDPQIPFWRVNARHILSMLRPGGIVVCHDHRPWTVPMLKMVLPVMKQRGYRVVTVTQLLNETAA